MEELRKYPDATTRPMLIQQIHEALKNRQNVELNGDSYSVKKLLGDLLTNIGGKEMILPQHEEDYTIQIVTNVAFVRVDKMSLEHLMRQVLQGFGWTGISLASGVVSFYFGKLLKDLYYDRIIPVFLIDHPEIINNRSIQLLQILSEYVVDRKPLGVPSIVCVTERYGENPLSATSFVVELLKSQITEGEILGILEEIRPGGSEIFKYDIRQFWLQNFHSEEDMKVRVRELLAYRDKLGLKEIDMDVLDQWRNDRKKLNAKSHA